MWDYPQAQVVVRAPTFWLSPGVDSQSSSGLQVVPGNREVGAQYGLALPTVTCTQAEPGLGLHPTPPRGQAVLPHEPTWACPGAVAGFRSRGVPPRGPWQGHQWPWLGFRAWLASASPSASRRRHDRAHSQWPAGYRDSCVENSGQHHDSGPPAGGRVHLPSPLGPPTPAAWSAWCPFVSRAAGL